MPGADHFALFNRALAERAALVQADVVHGGVGAVDVGDADFFSGAGEFFGLVNGGEFGLSGEFRKRGHLGCKVWAIMTWRLKFSTMFGSRRTSVGFFAKVMVSILSCSLSSA